MDEGDKFLIRSIAFFFSAKIVQVKSSYVTHFEHLENNNHFYPYILAILDILTLKYLRGNSS